MQLDVDRLIAYFGGVNALAEAFRQYDAQEAISTAAIYRWRNHSSLPLNQLQKLIALAESQDKPLDLNAFMQHKTLLQIKEISGNNRVIIFNITLRDGKQLPGAAMTKEEKPALPINSAC